ncbi:hypothetical protein AMJ86_05455, partial [bacterium SM23_57]
WLIRYITPMAAPITAMANTIRHHEIFALECEARTPARNSVQQGKNKVGLNTKTGSSHFQLMLMPE